jgi:alanine racemase
MIRRYAKKLLSSRSAKYQPFNHIELSTKAVLHNIAIMQAKNPGLQIMPVLKANAYGHGRREIAQILNDVPCRLIIVDGYYEAGKIRDISKHRLLVMSAIRPENVRLVDTKRCSFVVQDITGLRAFASLRKKVRIHLELNTGMNRLGLQPDELEAWLDELRKHPNLHLEGVMSHLANSENKDGDEDNQRQVVEFDKLMERVLEAGFRPELIHLAQTVGSVKTHSLYANAIRLGAGTYGINPLDPEDRCYKDFNDLRPVMELKSTIIKTLVLAPGDKVSYDGTFTAPKAMRIGILPLGYYEGIHRQLSNCGVIAYGGTLLPIIGSICMNYTMIDLTGTEAAVMDEVTLISRDGTLPCSIPGWRTHFDIPPWATYTNLSEDIRRIIVT